MSETTIAFIEDGTLSTNRKVGHEKATAMVKVTAGAKEELKRTLEGKSLDPDRYLRLVTRPAWEGEADFGIVIDEFRDGDYVVHFQGVRVLLVDAGLEERLANAEFDFKDAPDGPRFTLDLF